VQFCLSMRLHADGSGLVFDYSASDNIALSMKLPRQLYCALTHWCGGPANGSSNVAAYAPPSNEPEESDGPREPKTFAVVIKGPLLRFTVNVIDYYASQLLNASNTAVIFSHNNGSCLTPWARMTLRELGARYSHFAYTLQPAPASSGANFRNFQREASFYGALLAVRLFRSQYVLVQRPDSVFQSASLFPDLHALLQAQPPPSVPMPGGRVGLCPIQTQLSDVYGRFHLDDHCMFGRSEAVLNFWSVSNQYYRAGAAAWSHTVGNKLRLGCPFPGAESDQGYIWVLDASTRLGIPPPASTAELLQQRAFVLNPEAWKHVCLRGKGGLDQKLPVSTEHNVMTARVVSAYNPYSIPRLCEKKEMVFDCSAVPAKVRNETHSPRWACKKVHTKC